MKKLLILGLAICGMIFLAGCGEGVDENKTPEQIQSEVSNMSTADIEAMAKKYQKAIAEKAAELEKEVKKLSDIPLTEQLGDEAKKLRGNIGELKSSLDKLQANLDAYLAGLKSAK